MRTFARKAGMTVLCAAALAGYWVASEHGGPYAAAAVKPAEPHRITLVRGETGLALGSLKWSTARRASGELGMTGEGAAQLGQVRVTVRRSDAGSIESLRLAGHTNGIAKSWTLKHGHWSAS